MCPLSSVEIGRLTSCRQTVLVYLVSCYPKRKSDSRVRSWEIWTIFHDDFFFPSLIFSCGIWLCMIPTVGNRISGRLFLGWSLLSYESQDSWGRFGHELSVAVVWMRRGVCVQVCVCVSKYPSVCWPYGKVRCFLSSGIWGILGKPSF